MATRRLFCDFWVIRAHRIFCRKLASADLRKLRVKIAESAGVKLNISMRNHMDPPFPLDVFVRMSEIILDYRLIESLSCVCRRFRRLARNIRATEFAGSGEDSPVETRHGIFKWSEYFYERYRYGKLFASLNLTRDDDDVEIYLENNLVAFVGVRDEDEGTEPVTINMIRETPTRISFPLSLDEDGEIVDTGSKKVEPYRAKFRKLCDVMPKIDDIIFDVHLLELASSIFI